MSPEAPDLTDVEFRLRNARAGVALSVFCGLHLAAYRLATGPSRTAGHRPDHGRHRVRRRRQQPARRVLLPAAGLRRPLLAGDAIPLEARILHVADAFDTMTSERTYSAAMPVEDALAELRRCAGRQFDAVCVEHLCAALAGPGDGARPVDDVVGLV
jgi:hypothetical protein